MSHTPGPWRVTEWPGVSGSKHFGIETQKWRLAIVYSGNADDATLMAAAPDLLQVLQDLYGYEDVIEEWDGDLHARMRAAIAKAEGRE